MEDKNEKLITGLKRISKPGLRIYAGKDQLPKVLGGNLESQFFLQTKVLLLIKKLVNLQVGGVEVTGIRLVI